MTARRVHSVLAAGLQNPDLIARWREDPRLLRDLGVGPDEIDLGALWKFSGLTVKVRHNGIRDELPLTFRLMNVLGLEIEVFASYAAFRATRVAQYADTADARIQDLIAFLEKWLNLDRADHSLLWDLIRHEHAVARLTTSLPASLSLAAFENSATSQCASSGASIPIICGEIILHEMRCDPQTVGTALRDSAPQLDQIQLENHFFCYWRPDTTPEIQILQLDELGYYILSLVDGSRSTAILSTELGGSRRPTRGFLTLINQLGDAGILKFRPRTRNRVQ